MFSSLNHKLKGKGNNHNFKQINFLQKLRSIYQFFKMFSYFYFFFIQNNFWDLIKKKVIFWSKFIAIFEEMIKLLTVFLITKDSLFCLAFICRPLSWTNLMNEMWAQPKSETLFKDSMHTIFCQKDFLFSNQLLLMRSK